MVLNAVDAARKGATILPRHKVINATRKADHWQIDVQNTKNQTIQTHHARQLVNAAGPWVTDVISNLLRINTPERVRLVRGSHIIVRKIFDHDQPYILQGSDGRVVFAIPYEQDFTLIGTTDREHSAADDAPHCTDEEAQYLCDFINGYFSKQITLEDIIWRYSGVRPLYDDGASSATDATRDYVLSMDKNGPEFLNIYGGKITTYRRLAQKALEKLGHAPDDWTTDAPMPGGDFALEQFDELLAKLLADYPFLTPAWANRLMRHYGSASWDMLGGAKSLSDLGDDFGATLYAQEVDYLCQHEFAQSVDDVVWRRTKLGLRLSPQQIQAVDAYIKRETQ